MSSPFLYFPDTRLSRAELSAACLDGDLVAVGDGYIPADAVATTALRAASLRPLLGESLAATHLSAAWVHGVLSDPPARHRARRVSGRRQRHVPDGRLDVSDRQLPASDCLLAGGVWVTSPVRTVADLLREPGDAPRNAAASLLRDGCAGVGDAIAWLESAGPLQNKRRALALLQEWAYDAPAQPEVTR